MENETQDLAFHHAIKLILQHKLFYLVGKQRLNELPQSLTAYTSYATPELLDAIGIPVTRARKEVFIFSTERFFYVGSHLLKEREGFDNYELSSVCANAQLLFEKVFQLGPEVIHLDFGQPHATEMPEEQYKKLKNFKVILRLAELGNIYILSDTAGYAVELPFEDEKLYAVAFIAKDSAADTIAACQERSPGCKVEFNHLRDVIRGVMQSRLEGLVLDLGRPEQLVIDREQLKLLDIILHLMSGEKSPITRFFKGLFGKPE